jgi:hypothetical protein
MIMDWASAWGVKINTKPGKTEAMLFSPSYRGGQNTAPFRSNCPDAGLPPLDAGVQTGSTERLHVHWVDSYKYLGFPLTLSLDTTAYVKKRIEMLQLSFTRYFDFNRTIRRLPLQAQMQIANNLCLGQINYLLGIVPVKGNAIQQLETIMRKMGRKILHFPQRTPNQLVDAEMIALPMRASILANSVRVRDTLRLLPSPYNSSPAAQLLAFTERLPNNSFTFGAAVSASLEKECRPYNRSGQDPIPRGIYEPPSSLLEVPSTLLKLKRSIAASSLFYHHPRHAALRNPRTLATSIAATVDATLRPPPLPPSEHLASLYCVGLTPSTLMVTRESRAGPLSSNAGGWSSGSLLHSTTIRPPSPLIGLCRIGRAGFHYVPFSDGHNPTSTGSMVSDDEPSTPSFFNHYLLPAPCPLCNDENDDPFHLLCECTETSTLQTALRASAFALLRRLMTIIRDGLTKERVDIATQQSINLAINRALLLCEDDEGHDEKDIRFVLFHLLTVTPFSATVAQAHFRAFGQHLPLTDALGSVFDDTVLKGRQCRPISNSLVNWADGWLLQFASLRKRLINNLQQGEQQTNLQEQQG